MKCAAQNVTSSESFQTSTFNFRPRSASMCRTSIDIVVCTYNNAALLNLTLAALAKQQVSAEVSWRILIVNNNCTDNTIDVVDKHSHAAAVQFEMIVETKQGLTPARLCGAKHAAAEWIAFVDDDCVLAEDWVEQVARFAVRHPSCGAFGGKIVPVWEMPPPSFVSNHLYAYAAKHHGETACRRSWLAGAGMVVRREALERCGWIDEQFLEDRSGARLVSGGDMEIGLRIASRYEVWYNPACIINHIIPARRMSIEYLRRIIYGLGASRHNAEALKWRRSYSAWLFYAALYSAGLAIFGVIQVISKLLNSDSKRNVAVEIKLAIATLGGWWAAMWGMFWMDAKVRRRMLGCAVERGKEY